MNIKKLALKNVDHWLLNLLNVILLLALPAILLYFGFKNETIKVQTEAVNVKEAHIIKEAEAKEVDPATMTTEDYICYKFGPDCKMALAVSQGENGTRQCDRFGVNTNKTIDVGVFQINSVHLKKGYTLTDLSDCHKNVDIAFEIYSAQGWSPWVAYTNGSYKKFLK